MAVVLAVVAHADDELLGVGATLRRHVVDGDEVHIVIAADCRCVRDADHEPMLDTRATIVAKALGFQPPIFLGFPALEFASAPELARNVAVSQAIDRVQPDIVYTHHYGDINVDHRAVARAVEVACRPIERSVARLLAFETPSSTEWGGDLYPFKPDVFVDVADTLADKLDALEVYDGEMKSPPHPRSDEMLHARAAYWGQIAGLHYAEPFMLIREIR